MLIQTNPHLLKGGIYLRLSKDDEAAGESTSISNQRKLLIKYAGEHDFLIKTQYTDDGYSGTTFNRPGFRQMIADIEAGEINLVLTKDLSRLGRDYIKTGQYTELYFPSHGVRFIAVGDGYDSAFSNSDFLPFRNVLNEMYARDISGKIKAALQVRMEEGDFIGNFAPYGYLKSPDDRHLLVPDSSAAPIVVRIFSETAAGGLPRNIADELNAAGILPPSLYRCQHNPKLNPADYTAKGIWTANTIIKILHNPVYLGHMVQGKHKKFSFKSSLTLPVPPEDRIAVRCTHLPLISETIFAACEEQLRQRTFRKTQR